MTLEFSHNIKMANFGNGQKLSFIFKLIFIANVLYIDNYIKYQEIGDSGRKIGLHKDSFGIHYCIS